MLSATVRNRLTPVDGPFGTSRDFGYSVADAHSRDPLAIAPYELLWILAFIRKKPTCCLNHR
jgi:hypothetical protein